MSAYRKDFDKTKYMSFLIKDDQSLEKYNEIQRNVLNSLKKEFDSKPIYNEKYVKAKIKFNNGKINSNFHSINIPKDDLQYVCLSVVLLGASFRTGKNYYPQVFLEECKYVIKEKRFIGILLMIQKFRLILMKKLWWKKFKQKKILIMKKILIRKFWKKIQMKNSNEEN